MKPSDRLMAQASLRAAQTQLKLGKPGNDAEALRLIELARNRITQPREKAPTPSAGNPAASLPE